MATGSGTGTPVSGGSGSSWVDIAEADTYFQTRYGVGTLWSQFSDDSAIQAAILITAQQPIEYSTDYEFSDELLETPSQEMKDAVCEQALFMILDPDMELRQVLQAQGVMEAGIVLEKYLASAGESVPVAPRAKLLLKSLKNDDNHEVPLVR